MAPQYVRGDYQKVFDSSNAQLVDHGRRSVGLSVFDASIQVLQRLP